jgi:chain length determinant protein (polysaccharide antigen chain regulator)
VVLQITDKQNRLPALPIMGYKLLEKEKAVLLNRKTDDPFIPQLRTIQTKIGQLEEMEVNPKKFKVVEIDQMAMPPNKPAKPKKALIVAVAGVLGLMLGIFIALIRRAIKNRKKSEVTELAVQS